MLRPQRLSNRAQKSLTKTLPAPVGGWNARDPLANMAETDAVILDNWFPRTADLQSRRGSIDWATGLPGQVNSLMVYAAAATSVLFAASGSGIYNVTAEGAVGAPVVTGLSSTKFNYTNVSNAGGHFLWAVNGADPAKLYDGANWSTPAVTGIGSLTTANFSHVNLWKRRLFLVEKNSMSVWYLGIDAIAGAASEIDFGPLFRSGGRIVATATWTIDGGNGMDDHLVIITSKGEVAVYQGTDPANASAFSLVGVYQLGSPIGNKCCVKYGGDLVLVTLDGFQLLSQALASTRINNKSAISNKISGAVSEAARSYQYNFGWHPVLFPAQDMLLFNIPVESGVTAHQYVMNTITGAWCRFTGWNANAFEVMNDELFFAVDGKVCKAWQGLDDSGAPIQTDAKPAFSYFDAPGREKQWKMAQPVFRANSKPEISIGLNVDFENTEATNSVSFAGPDNTWDNAMWDRNYWAGMQVFKDWQTVVGVGSCAALRMMSSGVDLDMEWSAIDYVYEYGGVI